jgi:hypothetical protein
MTKPAITKRQVKGTPLTYSELDTNFQNLRDATITLTAGGVSVVNDLNGGTTFVSDSLSISGDNTTKTITIELEQNFGPISAGNPYAPNYKDGTVQQITTASASFVVAQPTNQPVGSTITVIVTVSAAVAPATITFTGQLLNSDVSVQYHERGRTIEFVTGAGVAVIKILRTSSAYLTSVQTDFA